MNNVRQILAAGLLTVGFLVSAPDPARADAFENFKKILNLVHEVESDVPSGKQIDDAQELWKCLADGRSLEDCVQYVDQELRDNEYFNTVVSLYILVRKDDLWGIVGVVADWLGDDAPCLVADILFPGVGGEFCSLIKELAERAGMVLRAINEVFAKASEELWNAMKDTYCVSLGHVFGGCDSSEAPPPISPLEQVYNAVYRPQRQAGLDAVRYFGVSGSGGLSEKMNEMHAEAKDLAHSLTSTWDAGEAVVNGADMLYRQQVDADLSGLVTGIGPGSYAELSAEREAIFNNWKELADSAVASWANNGYAANPDTWQSIVETTCYSTLSDETKGFMGADVWIQWHWYSEARQLGMKTNAAWCSDTFWRAHEAEFEALFTAALNQHLQGLCPAAGNDFQCPDCQSLNQCTDIMVYFDDQDRSRCALAPRQALESNCPLDINRQPLCGTAQAYDYCLQKIGSSYCATAYAAENRKSDNDSCGFTAGVANERASALCQELRGMGSHIDCQRQIRKSAGANVPARLVCTLPVQRSSCEKLVDPGAPQAGARSDGRVQCDYEEAPEYTKLKRQVADAVSSLEAPSGSSSSQADEDSLDLSRVDPLLVTTSSQSRCETLEHQDKEFGFGQPSTKPGFDYECNLAALKSKPKSPVDGLTTPAIRFSVPLRFNMEKIKETGKPRQSESIGKDRAESAIEAHGPEPSERIKGLQQKVRGRDVLGVTRIQMGARKFSAQSIVRFQAVHQKGTGLALEIQNRADARKAWAGFDPGAKLNVAKGAGASTCTLTGLPEGLWRVRARSDVAGAQWSAWTEFAVQR